jgi:hypothetical protein
MGRKRADQEDADFDYHFDDCLQRRTYWSRVRSEYPRICLETWSGGRVVSGNTRLLVEPDNSMPAVMLVDFASLDAGVVLLQVEVVAEGRLGL